MGLRAFCQRNVVKTERVVVEVVKEIPGRSGQIGLSDQTRFAQSVPMIPSRLRHTPSMAAGAQQDRPSRTRHGREWWKTYFGLQAISLAVSGPIAIVGGILEANWRLLLLGTVIVAVGCGEIDFLVMGSRQGPRPD